MSQLKLMQLFRQRTHDGTQDEEDMSQDNDVYCPKGNIFRALALSCEVMKHREELQQQIEELTETYRTVLDSYNPEQDEKERASSDAHEADLPPVQRFASRSLSNSKTSTRYSKLVYLLTRTKVEDSIDYEVGGLGSTRGYAPISDFLTKERTRRYFCGMFIVPSSQESFRKWCLTRFIALLVLTTQIYGPGMILVVTWCSPDNKLKEGLFRFLTWSEFTCVGGDLTEFSVVMLGTIFLVIIFEIVRQYAIKESNNRNKLATLPADTFWERMGQASNMVCCVLTVCVMPLVFWTEMYPKAIVFDSLAMLFIVALDHLSSGVVAHLQMSDETFQTKYMDFIAKLSQCPVTLRDIVNEDATSAEEIWRIRLAHGGLLRAMLRPSELCLRRLENAATEDQPLFLRSNTVLKVSNSFSYTVQGQTMILPGRLGDNFVRSLWYCISILLAAGEIVVPLVFLTASKPCYE